jgi:hypothetical protein
MSIPVNRLRADDPGGPINFFQLFPIKITDKVLEDAAHLPLIPQEILEEIIPLPFFGKDIGIDQVANIEQKSIEGIIPIQANLRKMTLA